MWHVHHAFGRVTMLLIESPRLWQVHHVFDKVTMLLA